MSKLTASVADQRAAADAAVEADQAAGLFSLFVIIGKLADEREYRIGSGVRRTLGDQIEEAARGGKFQVWLRSTRLPDSHPRNIGFDHIARLDDVRAWVASNAPGVAVAAAAITGRGGSVVEPEEEAPSLAEPPRRSVTHTTKAKRENVLSQIIDDLRGAVGERGTATDAWLQLVEMARRSPAPSPLIDVDAVTGGILYTGENGEAALTKKQFSDRFRRAKAR